MKEEIGDGERIQRVMFLSIRVGATISINNCLVALEASLLRIKIGMLPNGVLINSFNFDTTRAAATSRIFSLCTFGFNYIH